MNYTPLVSSEQLEVSGFKGPQRANRRLRGITTKQEARDTIHKMYINLPRQERRRLDYYRYEIAIRTEMTNFLLNNNRLPSVLELEYETGISRTTIYKHLKEDHKGFDQEFNYKVNKLRKQAIERLFTIGIQNGNVKALTEFLKLTSNEKADSINNSLIQINNIYIDQGTIQSLPDHTKEKLEVLLLESSKVDKG